MCRNKHLEGFFPRLQRSPSRLARVGFSSHEVVDGSLMVGQTAGYKRIGFEGTDGVIGGISEYEDEENLLQFITRQGRAKFSGDSRQAVENI